MRRILVLVALVLTLSAWSCTSPAEPNPSCNAQGCVSPAYPGSLG